MKFPHYVFETERSHPPLIRGRYPRLRFDQERGFWWWGGNKFRHVPFAIEWARGACGSDLARAQGREWSGQRRHGLLFPFYGAAADQRDKLGLDPVDGWESRRNDHGGNFEV